MHVWPTVDRIVREHGACTIVSVAGVKGSAPRETGARMIIRPDGRFHGTIGGGVLEWRAMAAAQKLLKERIPLKVVVQDYALGPELGQCCGGRVVLAFAVVADAALASDLAQREAQGTFRARFHETSGHWSCEILGEAYEAQEPGLQQDGSLIEQFGSLARSIYLFGAGHVGQALMLALAPLPFDVTWVDQRKDAFPQAVPANFAKVRADHPVEVLKDAPDGAFVVIMTHSHGLDLELSDAALRAERFGYVGVIGSATKRARFVKRLRQAGLAKELVDTLVCPVGLGDVRSKLPAAIAVSVAAELVSVDCTAAQMAGEQHSVDVSGVETARRRAGK